jgi:hypothetical protein
MKTETIGVRELSAWQVFPGVVWIQSRSPIYTRKLTQRADSRLVALGVAGGYLRAFEFLHGLAWAGRLIGRYTKNETPTNEGKTEPASSSSAPETQASVTQGRQFGRPHRTRQSTTLQTSVTATLVLDFGQAEGQHPTKPIFDLSATCGQETV